MITASSGYLVKAASPNKVPIFLLEIEGYDKGFSNADLGGFSPLPFANQPGLAPTPTTSSAWTEDAQNPVYHYGLGTATGPQTGYIQRWASNSLLSHTIPGVLYFYNATGVYAAPGSDNPLAIPRSTLAAVFANVGIVIDNEPPGPGWAIEVSVDGGSTWHTILSTSTSGTYAASLDITSLLGSLATFDFSQIQIRVYTNESLTESDAHPGAVGTVQSVSLSFTYNSSIPTATGYPWLVAIDDQQVTVNDLDGGADLADLVVHVQDRGQGITASFPSFVFEGKQVHLRQGWGKIDPESGSPILDMDIADFATLFTGKIDSVESENSNDDYCFTCVDNSTLLQKVIFQTGDDGFPTDSHHVRTLNGHPLDILLAVLETEVGIDPSEIDIALITTYRDTIYSGMQFTFAIDSPPTAKDFIEAELLKPLGAYRRTNHLGQHTVVFNYPISTTPAFHFQSSLPADPADNLIEIPEAGQTDLINEVVTRFDSPTGGSSGNFDSIAVNQSTASIAKYGMFGSQTIESKGLRSGLNGFFFAAMTAFLIFLRYGFKALCHGDNGKNSSSNPINCNWNGALVDPGDFVTLSHPQVPDRAAGVLGVVNKTYVTLDRIWQYFPGNAQYKLVEVDLSKFKQFLITGNGEADYTAASSGDKASLMFLCKDSDQYSNGDPANTLC